MSENLRGGFFLTHTVVENVWGGSEPAQFRPGDGKAAGGGLWIDRHGVNSVSWRRL